MRFSYHSLSSPIIIFEQFPHTYTQTRIICSSLCMLFFIPQHHQSDSLQRDVASVSCGVPRNSLRSAKIPWVWFCKRSIELPRDHDGCQRGQRDVEAGKCSRIVSFFYVQGYGKQLNSQKIRLSPLRTTSDKSCGKPKDAFEMKFG